jgi:hypothetical protein
VHSASAQWRGEAVLQPSIALQTLAISLFNPRGSSDKPMYETLFDLFLMLTCISHRFYGKSQNLTVSTANQRSKIFCHIEMMIPEICTYMAQL